MRKILSLSLSPEILQFVENLSAEEKTSKSSVVTHALDLYRKFRLKKELREAAKAQTKEDVEEAMSDFEDYLKIVDS